MNKWAVHASEEIESITNPAKNDSWLKRRKIEGNSVLTSTYGRLVYSIVQLYAILPIEADLEPRCGVPRKQMPKVAGRMVLSRVPTVDAD